MARRGFVRLADDADTEDKRAPEPWFGWAWLRRFAGPLAVVSYGARADLPPGSPPLSLTAQRRLRPRPPHCPAHPHSILCDDDCVGQQDPL